MWQWKNSEQEKKTGTQLSPRLGHLPPDTNSSGRVIRRADKVPVLIDPPDILGDVIV
jgi:hypothetical protein